MTLAIHRNELIDPKFLLRQDGRDTLHRLVITDRLDVVGNSHALVDRSMLRGAVDLAPTHDGATARAVIGRTLADAIDAGNLNQWGVAYRVTDRARWYRPTYDYKKRRWDQPTSGVVFEALVEPAEHPELLIAEHYVHALWPWLSRPEDHEIRWNGAGPAVLCDRRIVGSYLKAKPEAKSRPCYPMVIIMGMRP